MDFDLSDDQLALQAGARELLDAQASLGAAACTHGDRRRLRRRALVGDGRSGLAGHRGRRSAGRRRARRGRGRGAVRGARPPRRAGAVRLDGARDRRVARVPVKTLGSIGWSRGDALACVAWDPTAPVPYAPSADIAVVITDDGVYAMEIDDRPRREPAMDLTRELGWLALRPGRGAPARRRRRSDAAARSRRDLLRGRHARERVARARPGGRVRQGPRAVRPADRVVPGREASVRRHARRRRGHAVDGLLGGLVHRCRRSRSIRSRRRPRRRGAPTRRSG